MGLASRWSAAAGTVVFASSLLATLVSAPVLRAPVAANPSIPARVANYSYLTGDVSASAPGRAIALFQHGFGVELLDFPQGVMIGAYGQVYRRVDVAEDRAGSETQGDPAPMLLSPDGIQVAVGDYTAPAADIAVQDLQTAGVEVHELPQARGSIPLAWSPDAQYLAYITAAEPFQPFASLSGSEFAGELGLLEVRTGESVVLPGATGVRRAAFSPGGDQLALDTGGALRIIDLDGATITDLSIQTGRQLDGPNAWSPDGALLAMAASYSECGADVLGLDEAEWVRCMNSRSDSLTFVDATGRGAPVPEAVPDGSAGTGPILGWMGDREVLVLQDTPDAGADDHDPYWLSALPLGGEPRRLSALPGGGNYGIGGFQLASGLVPEMSVDPAGGPVDRGPWPVLPAMTVSLLAAAVAMSLTEWGRSWWVRRHRRA